MTCVVKTLERSSDTAGSLKEWQTLRQELWPDMTEYENDAETRLFMRGGGPLFQVLLAYDTKTTFDHLAGFAEISERNVADSCGTDPVAYLEGWYVRPSYQKQGIGHQLIQEAETFARQQGYTYLASDTEIDNVLGLKAHLSTGFENLGAVIQFRKSLR